MKIPENTANRTPTIRIKSGQLFSPIILAIHLPFLLGLNKTKFGFRNMKTPTRVPIAKAIVVSLINSNKLIIYLYFFRIDYIPLLFL